MKKPYILGLIGVCILAVTFFVLKGDVLRVLRGEGSVNSNLATRRATTEEAWAVFEQYLVFAKSRDLEGLKSLSHQLSAPCKDPSQIKECNQLMDSAYTYGFELQKEDFVNIWEDSKQIILFTNPEKILVATSRGYIKGIIYFTKDSSGNIKLLSFSPGKGFFIKTAGKTDEEIEAALASMMKDSDEDGLEDEVEVCKDQDSDCIKTDPNKRDTNGNGWWDGIEALFK